MDKTHKLKSRAEARAALRAQGLTVKEWAEAHNLSPKIVFELLGGRIQGNYGQSHKAAVLLGLKPAPTQQ